MSATLSDPQAILDLNEIIESSGVMIRELNFQVMRLDTQVVSRDEKEKAYHERLRKGYAEAAYWTQVLQQYHVKRRTKLTETPYREERNDQDKTA